MARVAILQLQKLLLRKLIHRASASNKIRNFPIPGKWTIISDYRLSKAYVGHIHSFRVSASTDDASAKREA